MPAYSELRCGVCRQITDKLRLTIKRITFSKMSSPDRVCRSRTKAWICNRCLEEDEDWNLQPFAGPGHTSAARERIKQRREGSS